jgi:predicted transcriptional regulator
MHEPLGDLQLQVMQEVWRLGRTTVAQVHEALGKDRKIAYTTVLTTMQGLERRGMVRHEQPGKAYVYTPVVDRQAYAAASVGKLVDDLFGGRREGLLCHLLGAERISGAEHARIRRIIASRKDKGAKP